MHDKNGLKLNALESARLISIFDGIYMNELQAEGYKIIKIPDNLLTSDHFYDAVHLSPSGSLTEGTFYAETIFPEEKIMP